MSIAEQIMAGTQQTNILARNLSVLGQQVGQQLAMREYQKQAAEALPAMQAAYKSAMDDVAAGEVATGYQKFIDAQLQFGTSQNPFIADAANNVGGGFTNFVKVLESQKQRQSQYGGGLPAVDASAYGFGGTGDVLAEGGQPEGMPEGELLPEQQPLQGTPEQRAQQAAAQREMLDQQSAANLTQQEAQPQATPAQLAGQKNFQDVTSLPVNEQRNAAMSYGVAEVNPKQYEVVKIAGLEKYLPEFEGFAVPKESWKETGASLSGTGLLSRQSKLTAPEARENFLNPEKGTQKNVKSAIETMKDKTMTSLFNDYGQDIYSLRAATDSKADPRNQNPIFTVTTKDGKDKRITQDQYLAIQTIAGIVPATSEDAGGTPAIFRPKKKTPKELVAMAKQELGANATQEQVVKRARELANQ